MNRTYSWIALGVGVVLSTVLLVSSTLWSPEGQHTLPLLTSLLLCEVGFIATAIGFALGVHQLALRRRLSSHSWVMVANLLLALNFARMGLMLWPMSGIS